MKYIKGFNENMSMAKSIISKKMEGYNRLKELLSKNLGYIGKFTEYLMNENIPISDLELLYKDLLDLKNKQKGIDITNLKYEEVIDKINQVNNDLSVNSLINRFPSEQKALAKDLIKNNGYNILLQTSKKENIDTLLKKISRYKTKEELKNALRLFGKESINDKKEILDYVRSNSSVNIVFQNENILIIRISKIEDVQKLGSNTSWCILRDAMWKSYTTNRYQFILYNFDKDELDPDFKIGFTISKDYSLYAAHNVLDNSYKVQLGDIIQRNGIKYTDLIPQTDIEKMKVTEDTINKINSRTALSLLNLYAESVDFKLIPNLVSKIIDIYSVNINKSKSNILKFLINKYFANSEFVTLDMLVKLDKRIPKILNQLYMSDIFRRKYISDDLDFKLPSNLIIKSLEILDDEKLFKLFSRKLFFIKIPGDSYYYGNTLKFVDWTEDQVKILSDKLNELFDKDEAKNILNNYQLGNFNENYVILNYVLDRKEKVDKSVIDNLREDIKISNAFLLKLPIDISKLDYNKLTSFFNEWSIPLIIKKDYEIEILINTIDNSSELIKHLTGYKLKFKITKQYLKNIMGKPIDDNNKYLLKILKKFRTNYRKGDIVKSDDNLISIKVY